MKFPTICGLIDRRILANYRVQPDVLQQILPAPFRPQLVNGFGIAGICLIRLSRIRPSVIPSFLGLSSENAAHRIAVEWDSDGGVQTGVYVPRRDTSSTLNTLVGGRIFPGIHRKAEFDVHETADQFRVSMRSVDGSAEVCVDGRIASELPDDSVFGSTKAASDFFEHGSMGYSPDHSEGRFEGLELRTMNWHAQPMSVSNVASSFFDDQTLFPSGAVEFDHALLMRGVRHEWHSLDEISSDAPLERAAVCV